MILQFIKSDLQKLEPISLQARAKPIADKNVLKGLIHYLFACDEANFCHERIPVQLSLCLFIMCYTGSRPGTIVESQYHRGSNAGLVYRDVEVILLKVEGILKFTLAFKFLQKSPSYQ